MIRSIPSSTPGRQRGITLFGLVFWAVVISFLGYVGISIFPTVNEYLTIQRAVKQIAAASPQTVPEVRSAFDRQKQVEYSITTIAGKDLTVTKENDRVVISFAYDKEIALFGPVFLLIKYEGRSN